MLQLTETAPSSRSLAVRGLRKSFGSREVLRGASFAVAPGEIYGLLGPNGAGKTTILNALCGLLQVDAGTVRIAGRPPGDDVRHLLGVAPQEVSLYQDLTCEENLEFFGRVYGLPRSARRVRIERLIEQFRLAAHRHTPVSQMSGGWARRTNVAVACVHEPEVLFLDEPTAGLDIESRHALWELIEGLGESGAALVLTTHDLEEAERLCTRVGILEQGRIAAEGTLDELRSLVPARLVAEIESPDEDAIRRRAAALGWAARRYGGRLTLLLPEESSLRAVVERLGDVPLRRVSLRPVGLQQIYLEVVHGAAPAQRTPQQPPAPFPTRVDRAAVVAGD